MTTAIAVCVLLAAGAFCLRQFCHLMHRRDDEFPGRFDKPIWAAAILFGTIFGAFAYWLSQSRSAPESNDSLKREYATLLKQRAAPQGDAVE
jgi:hypothetical protein